MAAKRGLFKRIRSGWAIGLAQRETIVCAGTFLIVAQLGAIGYLMWRDAAPPAAKASAPAPASAAAPSSGRAWVSPGSAALYPQPATRGQAFSLPPYTPLAVRQRSQDGRWLRVDAVMHTGKAINGWVMAQQVQSRDPVTVARPQAGWVIVTNSAGAVLRAGPDPNAATFGNVPRGQVLRQIARVARGDLVKGASGEFVLIDNQGPAGRRGQAWVLDSQVAPAKPPSGKR